MSDQKEPVCIAVSEDELNIEKNPFHQRRATNSDDEVMATERRQELANMKALVKT
jgi:hypothetical protein